MKFELSYSILYLDLFKNNFNNEQKDLFGEVEMLDFNSAQLFLARLEDPGLVERMSLALKQLNLERSLDFDGAAQLLILELIHRQSFTNCFIWQQQISYSQTSGLYHRKLNLEEQTYDYFTSHVLAHGLRWGWYVVELIGKSAIVKAETEVVVNYNGCSCGIAACAHAAFATAVRAERHKMPYCIKLVNPTLI